MGCDPDRQDVRARDRPFQSTHPHGVRQRNNAVVFIPNEFQSTHPHGVRQPGKTGQNRPKKFQSTHPHGVRLRRRRRGGRGSPVSIHAPTWGATFVKRVEHHKSRVSIHAPTWGATTTWGLWPGAWRFQSTHPHGVRPTTGRRTCSCGCFNPRTHMGCDVALLIGGRAVLVSIHAPTWGATSSSVSSITRAGFQSTHPHGVRRKNGKLTCRLKCVSIHAPTWGATCL